MTIIVTMCKLFVALLLGYVLRKKKMLDANTSTALSGVVVNAVLPFLIINSVSGIQGDRNEVLMLLLAGFFCYAISPVIGWILVRIIRVPKKLHGTYICMVMFSNNIFMGYPITSALFGDKAIFYTTIFHILFNFMVFSVGSLLIRKDAGDIGAKDDKPVTFQEKFHAVRKVANNGMLAAVGALVIYFTGIQLPEIITETCSFIGNISMPMSMIVIGSSIAAYPLKDVFSEKKVYLITAVRLILMPLLTYFIMQFFTDNAEFIKIATITVGMPIASIVAMISTPYEEQGKEAAVAVVFSTLCSLITIPVMCMLLGA